MSCIGDFPSHVRPFVERASPAGDAGVPLYETCARGAVCRHKRRSALHHGSDNGKSLANEVQHKQCGERRHDPRSVDRPATPSFTDTHGALRHRAVNRHACRLQRRRHGQVAAYGSLPTAATRTVLQPAAMTKPGACDRLCPDGYEFPCHGRDYAFLTQTGLPKAFHRFSRLAMIMPSPSCDASSCVSRRSPMQRS
ncbi:hypothetical protein QFZ98_004926 [Paraburkholderia youngii]